MTRTRGRQSDGAAFADSETLDESRESGLVLNHQTGTGTGAKATAAGAEGWEMAGVLPAGMDSIWCFKRPKL
jgi:hypothetical protein